METHLYTFIMDYLGGTYVSQVNAIKIKEAMRLWINNLRIEDIEDFSNDDKQKIIRENFSDEDPTPLAGVDNVWHFLVTTEVGSGFINVVDTRK